MNIAEKVYNFNMDGSVRAEFVIMGSGVMPLDYFAKMLGTRITDVIEWKKSDLRGFLLNASYVNDEGQKCDESGTAVEDGNFTLLPGNKVDEWNHQLWVSHNGCSVITDEEWEEQDDPSYRRLKCMEVQIASSSNPFRDIGTIYITEEAVPILADMLIMDVLTGDQVVRRYQHECRTNEVFAQRYGFALEVALMVLPEIMREEAHRRQLTQEILRHCGLDTGAFRAMIFEPHAVDDKGKNVSEPDSNDSVEPVEEEDTSTHD